jgi:hypothetical protein
VPVDPAPKNMPTPVVPGPLVECAAVVRVENLHIGARVYVFSTLLAAEVGDAQAFDTTVDVPVAPLLILGDKIFARQIGCGHTSHNSTPPQLVGKAPALKPPHVVPPLDDCMTAVPVDKVEPGALVDVYVNNLLRGTAAAAGTSVTVPISGRLKVGDSVRARQRLCGQVTGLGEPTGVIPSTAKDWPMYHHDAQHSGRVECSDINSSNIATLKAAYPALTLNGDIISVPAVVAGKIYVGTSIPVSIADNQPGGGTLYRIDLATGNIERTFSFVTPAHQGSGQGETGIACTPAVIGRNVYFSALDGNIAAWMQAPSP